MIAIDVKIKDAERKLQQLYTPQNAFGNQTLLTELEIINNLKAEKEKRETCQHCDDQGMIEEPCEECNATGWVKTQCEHEG